MATVPATMAACPNGGVEIDSGLDTNHDGMLEPSEVTSRENVCAPAAPTPQAQQVVRVVAEPAGSNCPAGGVAVESGTDTNGNSVLDDGEVTSTTYVCAGEDGQNGSAGENGQNGSDAANLLVRVDVEPAGSNCPSGGEAVRVGADVNGDGVLQDTEVEDTAYLCGPLPAPTVIDGDYVIANSLDVAALAGVTEITGDVRVTSTTLTSLSLPNLQHVGSFWAESTPLAALSMPALVTVGSATHPGRVDIYEPLSTLDLSSLTTGYVWIGRDNLGAISLPSMQTGSIEVHNSSATSLSTTLRSGYVNISALPNLASLSLDDLTSGDISVADAPALQRLDLPALANSLAIKVLRTASLTSITAPNLTVGTSLFAIQSAPHLPTCMVQALAAQCGATNVTISGTDDTCP